ncbi:Spy/CpxP family protein refolding chaperone [Devosia sp.]|uniref:Spy/CpxP family protein refolding chaperone n=1 Tax=Devosia sp. TaxID=1871048 RepID=UPI001B09BCC8|nr:Spy/CpxP family protein refolding chaperone [Devosia sp.]MBO9587340.1 Spy/CpxP family protein refolding chaperone [Devosia sp.]
MTSTSIKTLMAVVATAIGLSAVAPAMAQPAPPAPDAATTQEDVGPGNQAFRPQGGGPRQHGGAGGFFDFSRGGEGIEIALVRLSHRLDLTTDQQALFDTLKTSALAAAEDFATATEGLRPTRPAEGEQPAMPDVAQRLETRIAFERAHVAALEAVQPSVAAFFDSLTDEQKAELMPAQGEHGPRGQHGGQGPRGFGGGNR